MKGKINVNIDENFEIMRVKARIKRMKTYRIERMTLLLCGTCIFLINISIFGYKLYAYGNICEEAIIFLLVACVFLWFGAKGIENGYIKKIKKEMELRIYPYDQVVEFDQERLKVSGGGYSGDFPWSFINGLSESNEYWFFEPGGIAIDKKKLNKEQYDFINEKASRILSQNKWIE